MSDKLAKRLNRANSVCLMCVNYRHGCAGCIDKKWFKCPSDAMCIDKARQNFAVDVALFRVTCRKIDALYNAHRDTQEYRTILEMLDKQDQVCLDGINVGGMEEELRRRIFRLELKELKRMAEICTEQ